jgi:5-methylcytosine-specific restriction endonuclease McrA
MEYSLAKQLKECRDCGVEFIGGFKAFRCKPCQKKARNEMRKEWNRRYSLKNRTKITAINVAYQKLMRSTNPEWREWEKTKYHKRRARIEGNGGTHTTPEWMALCSEYNHQCANCHEEKSLTRDHKIPLSRGGTNDISNLQPLCGSCNSSKGAKLTYGL